MSKKLRPTDLAFPRVVSEPTSECDEGMNVRTYLAGQALAGYMATVAPRADDLCFTGPDAPRHMASLGNLCVKIADAVIAALNEPAVVQETPLAKPVETPAVETPQLQEFPEVP